METARTDRIVRGAGSISAANSASARFNRLDPYAIALIFAALTIVFTWPLAKGLTRDIPGDLGDPLFNAWVLAWDATHLGRGWLQANIFYPHPLTLAYSELLVPQALQILPIYAVTGNPFLCYNLVFLSTFVLSGLGMFLFCRELTGSRDGGLRRGCGIRVRALPRDVDTAPPGDVRAVAAVRAVRTQTVFSTPAAGGHWPARPRRGSRRTCRAATTCSSSARRSRCTSCGN